MMFISEILHASEREPAAENAAAAHYEKNIADSRKLQAHWQTLSSLSSDDIRNINNAFYEYIKTEVSQFILPGDPEPRQNEVQAVAENFIKLLLPQTTSDIAERIKLDFQRQEMFARIQFVFSKVSDVVSRYANDPGEKNSNIDWNKITCPLDSAREFMQFLHNHLTDCNWQKISSSGNQKMRSSRRQALLEIEYRQCQYTPGDPDYAVYENKYRELAAQINADYDAVPIGYKNGFTPWAIRNILKPGITIAAKADVKRWTWQTYTTLKNIVNGKPSIEPVRNLNLTNSPEMELFKE